MSEYTPIINDQFRQYADMLCQHDRLLFDAATEPELDLVESEMTQLWNELDAVQQRSLSGLSSDLNWLRRGGQSAPKGKSPVEVTGGELRDLWRARDMRDWHKLLHYLRVYSGQFSPLEIAALRATAWQALGFPHVARMFGGLAARLEPDNARLAMLPLPFKPETHVGDHAVVEEG